MSSEPIEDLVYLQLIERLAHLVAEAAATEGWLSFLPDPPEATPSQRAVNELARHLRFVHFDGDGCVDHY
ncbi:hypothetical protein [Streptomyces sp. NBC_01481]|uniref:hypothetical protein n=1 Tax=Streptomyces sp. NBC_01481 TaxID=2975869 RepID=UPI002252CF23|nr:hypothetical protein [Streptomyces sp. NBC_01481]MCX4583909.1 hypothetical protein [Streptomyces sp. NBC_01481]